MRNSRPGFVSWCEHVGVGAILLVAMIGCAGGAGRSERESANAGDVAPGSVERVFLYDDSPGADVGVAVWSEKTLSREAGEAVEGFVEWTRAHPEYNHVVVSPSGRAALLKSTRAYGPSLLRVRNRWWSDEELLIRGKGRIGFLNDTMILTSQRLFAFRKEEWRPYDLGPLMNAGALSPDDALLVHEDGTTTVVTIDADGARHDRPGAEIGFVDADTSTSRMRLFPLPAGGGLFWTGTDAGRGAVWGMYELRADPSGADVSHGPFRGILMCQDGARILVMHEGFNFKAVSWEMGEFKEAPIAGGTSKWRPVRACDGLVAGYQSGAWGFLAPGALPFVHVRRLEEDRIGASVGRTPRRAAYMYGWLRYGGGGGGGG